MASKEVPSSVTGLVLGLGPASDLNGWSRELLCNSNNGSVAFEHGETNILDAQETGVLIFG